MALKVNLSSLSLDNIIYQFAVKSIRGAQESIYSNIQQYDNRLQLDSPTNISFLDNVLTFDKSANAERYTIISDIGESSEISLGTITD